MRYSKRKFRDDDGDLRPTKYGGLFDSLVCRGERKSARPMHGGRRQHWHLIRTLGRRH